MAQRIVFFFFFCLSIGTMIPMWFMNSETKNFQFSTEYSSSAYCNAHTPQTRPDTTRHGRRVQKEEKLKQTNKRGRDERLGERGGGVDTAKRNTYLREELLPFFHLRLGACRHVLHFFVLFCFVLCVCVCVCREERGWFGWPSSD